MLQATPGSSTTSISLIPLCSAECEDDVNTSAPDANESMSKVSRDGLRFGSCNSTKRVWLDSYFVRVFFCGITNTHLADLLEVVFETIGHGSHPELSEPVF